MVWIGVALAVALALRRLRGWQIASTLGLVAGVALAAFAGIAATLATVVVAFVALAVGSLVLRIDDACDAALALPVGLSLVGGIVGWLLPLPVHFRGVYLVGAVAICAWRARVIGEAIIALRDGWRRSVNVAPIFAAFAVACAAIASTAAWLPTMQSDDLAYHLGLPSQLQQLGLYSLDPSRQI